MREVPFAGEEPQERAPAAGHVVADRAGQDGEPDFQRVEDGTLRHRFPDLEQDVVVHPRKGAQVRGQDDAHAGDRAE